MENIAENNIKIALELGFQKTSLGWYDSEGVLAHYKTEKDNTFDELLFDKNDAWLSAALLWLEPTIVSDDLLEIFESLSYDHDLDMERAYDLLLQIVEENTNYPAERLYDQEEEKEYVPTEGEVIERFVKSYEITKEHLREKLIPAIKKMALDGIQMQCRLYCGDTGYTAIDCGNVYVLERGFNEDFALDGLTIDELMGLYSDGCKQKNRLQ